MTEQNGPGERAPKRGGTNGIDGLRILYAEDHRGMQRAVERLLQIAGASVVSVRDGMEATKRALAETFDLVLMDLRMPGMDGCEAARALRAGGCRVLLLAVTAEATPEVRANALAAGFDAVLPKPFGLGDLLQALEVVRAGPTARTGVASSAAGRDSSRP